MLLYYIKMCLNTTLSFPDKLLSMVYFPDKLLSMMSFSDKLLSMMSSPDKLLSMMSFPDKLLSMMSFPDKLLSMIRIEAARNSETWTHVLYVKKWRSLTYITLAHSTSLVSWLKALVCQRKWNAHSHSSDCLRRTEPLLWSHELLNYPASCETQNFITMSVRASYCTLYEARRIHSTISQPVSSRIILVLHCRISVVG